MDAITERVCGGWKRPQAHFSGHVSLYSHFCVRWGLQEWRKPSLLILGNTVFFLYPRCLRLCRCYRFISFLTGWASTANRPPGNSQAKAHTQLSQKTSTGIKPTLKGLVNLLLSWSWPEFCENGQFMEKLPAQQPGLQVGLCYSMPHLRRGAVRWKKGNQAH